jgi:predicted RNase H-like nuclease (RuvC/YqgF family)
MPKASTRLTAVLTGRGRETSPIEAHERNVLAITRAIHSMERRRRALRESIAALNTELRGKRRELRAVLQRDSRVTENRLELAGPSDAIDAAAARLERGERSQAE